MEALERAWKALGTRGALAKALGVSASTVTMWQRRGRIPAEQVVRIERASGVPRHELRPDLFEPERQ